MGISPAPLKNNFKKHTYKLISLPFILIPNSMENDVAESSIKVFL